MTHFIHSLLLVTSLWSLAEAAEKPKGPKLPPLPTAPKVDIPTPMPGSVTTLPEGVEIVIDYSGKCIVAAFPEQSLKVDARFIPAGKSLILPGKFLSDDDGTTVIAGEKEFIGPCWLYRVKAAMGGDCELMVLPEGGTASDMIRRRIKCVVGPQPPPKPDDPVVPVDPAPIPVEGFRVLIVYNPKVPVTPAQGSIMAGVKVRDYLDANCPTGPGGLKEYRIWPTGEDASREAKLWSDAYARPRASHPWVIISNGKTGFEGPLPDNQDAFLTLCDKYLPKK